MSANWVLEGSGSGRAGTWKHLRQMRALVSEEKRATGSLWRRQRRLRTPPVRSSWGTMGWVENILAWSCIHWGRGREWEGRGKWEGFLVRGLLAGPTEGLLTGLAEEEGRVEPVAVGAGLRLLGRGVQEVRQQLALLHARRRRRGAADGAGPTWARAGLGVEEGKGKGEVDGPGAGAQERQQLWWQASHTGFTNFNNNWTHSPMDALCTHIYPLHSIIIPHKICIFVFGIALLQAPI